VVALLAATAGLILGANGDGDEPKREAGAERPAPAPAKLPPDKAVGQLLVMSFDGTQVPDYIRRRLRDGQGTGVILFAKNAPDAATLSRLTAALQRAAGRSALIATDQEGGQIRSVPFAPPQESQARLSSPKAAAESARAGARGLKAGGINVNLAPVADVANGIGSVLAGRAYPGDAESVARLVRASVEAHERERVAATVKHFPGLGRAGANTDDEPVTLDTSARELQSDLTPFRRAIEAGVPLVMTSHALYTALDREAIASQSKAVLGILRDELGFNGVVVTDSIEAQAVLARSGVAEAAERSVEAGADLVLMTGSGSWNEVQPRLVARARRDRTFRARVDESAGRVIALKRMLGLPAP
jgi:beta-N-acetylhexosaminidase